MDTNAEPNWSDVRNHLCQLLSEEPVTKAAVATDARGEHVWEWAIRQDAPIDANGRLIGPSPFQIFVRGASARLVRRVLLAWICHRPLLAISATEFAQHVLRNQDDFRRCRIGGLLADHLEQHPGDWRYLHEVVDQLHPGAHNADDGLEDAFPRSPHPPRANVSGLRSVMREDAPQLPTGPVAAPRASRPTLRPGRITRVHPPVDRSPTAGETAREAPNETPPLRQWRNLAPDQ